MAQQVEAIRRAKHRTHSELVCEALRTCVALARNFPEDRADIRVLRQAQREHERGETIPLSHALSELSPRTHKPRAKTARLNHSG